MTVKTILLHLHDTARAERLLKAAIPLARAHSAHLIAMTVVPPYVTIPAADGAGVSVTLDAHRIAYGQDIAGLKAQFEDAAQAQQLSIEWREVDAGFGTAAAQVIEHARCADLVISAQKNENWGYSASLEEPDRVVIECGRPVLMVPNTGPIDLPPRRTLIAWNATREAARATASAIALLPRGSDVTVLWVDAEKNRAIAGDVPGADLCTALARHGLNCETVQVSSVNGDAGAAILKEATARGVDLIVMGAYGHSRFREFLLGGASRSMLAHMDKPVLMSH